MRFPRWKTVFKSLGGAAAGGICVYKYRHGGPEYDRNVKAENKTIIVTGATSGIGKAAAWEFANRGAKVYMACRDLEKCEAVRSKIVTDTNNKYVYCRACDLASTASIRQFVAKFKSEERQLHILVNNAAQRQHERVLTADGFEAQLGVNHLGHFLLTNLLLDTLKESAPCRVIQITCDAYLKGKIQKENFTGGYDNYSTRDAYRRSRLANLLFASELGRQMIGSKVAVIAVDPGFTDTELYQHLPISQGVKRLLIYPIHWAGMKRPKMAAQVVLHAALDPQLQDVKGDLYIDKKKVDLPENAKDLDLALWLWEVSEKLTKLSEHKTALSKSN